MWDLGPTYANIFATKDVARKSGALLYFFFFFWWGLLHGPQQGPDRMKEKTYKTGKRKTPA